MDLIVLPSNRPPNRFYHGGTRITSFRGEAPAGGHEPEDWIASTTSVFGDRGVGITTLPGGVPLQAAVQQHPRAWLGPDDINAFGADTKLLVKLLDAGQRLPIHAPRRGLRRRASRAYPRKGRSLAHSQGGTVYLGLRRDVEVAHLRDILERQDTEALLDLLHSFDVEPGDTVFVPAGQLHAVGEGAFLLEVQEPEDLSILLEWRDFDLDGRKDGHLGLGFDLALKAVTSRRLDPSQIDHLIAI